MTTRDTAAPPERQPQQPLSSHGLVSGQSSPSAQGGGVAGPGGLEPLVVSEIMRGRNVFIMGATGFVGKVLLSMLLDRFPQVGRVYVMVRRGTGTDSESRFWNSVVTAPPFDPLRAKYGEGMAAFLKEKVVVVDGDITDANLGMTDEVAARVAADIDVIINSSGRVSFNPPLESALRTNVQGTKNVLAFTKRMKRPALIHTSTCFVAGNRSGEVWENEPLDGYFPRWREMPGTKFSVEQEIADSDRIALEVRAQADDAQVMARLREQARGRLREQSRNPDDEGALRFAIARERKDWIREQLTQRGMDRAATWGWPNIYTYTKSMGDQLVARETGVVRAIVRPAIVESAQSFPFPGWNEGFTTSAPLVYLALKGQNLLPVGKKLILDVVPVDHICAGMIMVAAQACVEQPQLVYQLSSGDLNPAYIDRVVTMTGLYKRKVFKTKETGNEFLNRLAAKMEIRPVPVAEYNRWSLPLFKNVASHLSRRLEAVRPRWGGGRLTEAIQRAQKDVNEAKRVVDEAHSNVLLFKPFVQDNKYIFRADHIRGVRDRLSAADRALVPWSPETIDIYDYWMNVHFPGLQKWVMPGLDETYAARPKVVYAYKDLLELFETATKAHATRVAMRITRGGREEIYSYENLQELATRAAAFLVGQGVGPDARVLLFAKNGPEWGMAYFGILKHGSTVVPVAHESTTAELVNIARAAGAVAVMGGDDLLEKRVTLQAELAGAGLNTKVWSLSQVFEVVDEALERERLAKLSTKHSAEAVASLIFTSGTTGKPKGVMLTHRNFTFMVSELTRIFEFGVSDGMLSVLPLHHTFEFSAGLLMPLARGAQITYLSELSGEAISTALKKGHVTAIVGVPALWDLLKRRVLQRFGDKSPLVGGAMKALMAANYELRARTNLNLGVLAFFPVHEGFGGRIRYLISGGSALPPEVLKTFYGLGFDFFEGYGLTETAPVLTVTSPKEKPVPGSVGKPLPGVEIRIDQPDASGVGEVIARGRNVMSGYWGDDEATAAVIKNGWFHTGDLGRVAEDGNLYLVGRSKEIIVDSNGKNVYPDEIEELYANSPAIKELSVVGLPDGVGEHIACAVVVDAARGSRGDLERQVRDHVRQVSLTLPFWKRIKTLEFWDGDLPRTSTRKVKRREVVAELLRRSRAGAADGAGGGHEHKAEQDAGWFLDVVAKVSGKPRTEVQLSARVEHLGFDSLMFSELVSGLEALGVNVPGDVDFTGASDVAGLLTVLKHARAASVHAGEPARKLPALGTVSLFGEDDIAIPKPLANAGRKSMAYVQRLFYERALSTHARGLAHIPRNVPFIVAANHSSHLDMGAIKVALGDAGRDLASLAAADYFFSSKWRRAYFANFTNLVPMERSGSIRKSLEAASAVLRGGRSMVVFPEGTRSVDGQLRTFLPSLGYLALRSGVGILPVYVGGAFEALPKGAALPKTRDLSVTFGPFLSIDVLQSLAHDRPGQEAWRLVAAVAQRVVENLRDGVPPVLEASALLAVWDGEQLGPLDRPSFNARRRVLPHAPPKIDHSRHKT